MKSYIEINSEICKGCILCIPECPKNVIVLSANFNSKGWRYAIPENNKDCIGCTRCAVVCPECAIIVKRED